MFFILFNPNLSDKKKEDIRLKIETFSKKINVNKKKSMNLKVKLYFNILKRMQKSLKQKEVDSIDVKYWQDQGWIS